MQALTQKQKELFNYIKNYIKKNRIPPSFEEIQSHFGFASQSSVYKYIHILKEKGFIHVNKPSKSAISLEVPSFSPAQKMELPLLGYLCDDGEIEEACGEKTVSFALNKKISSSCYFLKIKGLDFQEAGLLNNDLIIIEPRSEARTGEVILVNVYQEELLIKKYFPVGPYVRLESMMIDIEPMIVLPEEVRIQGVLLGMIREF